MKVTFKLRLKFLSELNLIQLSSPVFDLKHKTIFAEK